MSAMCNESVCSQGMMGNPGLKGLPQYTDVRHKGRDQYLPTNSCQSGLASV